MPKSSTPLSFHPKLDNLPDVAAPAADEDRAEERPATADDIGAATATLAESEVHHGQQLLQVNGTNHNPLVRALARCHSHSQSLLVRGNGQRKAGDACPRLEEEAEDPDQEVIRDSSPDPGRESLVSRTRERGERAGGPSNFPLISSRLAKRGETVTLARPFPSPADRRFLSIPAMAAA